MGEPFNTFFDVAPKRRDTYPMLSPATALYCVQKDGRHSAADLDHQELYNLSTTSTEFSSNMNLINLEPMNLNKVDVLTTCLYSAMLIQSKRFMHGITTKNIINR